MTRRIEAILFDLGDTLLDFGRVNLPSLFDEGAGLAYEYLRSLGGVLPPFERFRRRHLRAIHWHVLISRLTGRDFNSQHVIEQQCRRFGLRLSDQQALELCWLWYEPLHRTARVEEGLCDVLREFRRDGLKIGLVSNTFIPGPVLDRHLDKEQLLELLPVRVYSCDTGRRKPHRKIFQEALRRLEVSAEETLFVGDMPKTDIHGASRVGMITVLKDCDNRHNQTGHIRPDHRIHRLSELRAIVAKYRQVNPA
jgi:putative hydrolase of the HAD superfamily